MDRALEAAILDLPEAGGRAPISPGEIAHRVRPDDRRPPVEPVRRAARRLAAAGRVGVLQAGRGMGPGAFKDSARLSARVRGL